MNFFENIKMAFSSIAANKMRSLLTMLGIIIGISAVITITTLGTTLRSTVKGALDSLGTNVIGAYLIEREGVDEDEAYILEDDLMSLDMLKELIEEHDYISISSVNDIGAATVLTPDSQTVKITLSGGFEGAFDYSVGKIIAGRPVTMRDSDEKKYSCVVSDIFVKQYFREGEEPLGKVIKVTLSNNIEHEFTIVGVYKYNQMRQESFAPGTKEMDKQTPVVIPYSIAADLSTSYQMNGFYFTLLSYSGDHSSDEVKMDLTEFFDEKYENNRFWQIGLMSLEDEVSEIDDVISIVTVVVSVIAAISLIVGGVGVMNIMLVSVTERTREIGIRKALGAKRRSIKLQFLTEAIIICLIGGLIGITIGLLNSELIGLVVNLVVKSSPEYADLLGRVEIVPSAGAIIISLVFSTLTGVFFGLYPAGKAAKMNPIDALRYD